MKYNHYFLVLMCLATDILTSYAMENDNKNKAQIITELPNIEKFKEVEWLKGNSVAMLGEKGCILVDIVTKEQKKISNFNHSYVAVHPNKEKIALLYGTNLSIYDAKKGKKKWSKESKTDIKFCAFSETDDSIFVYRYGHEKIKKYDYTTNSFVKFGDGSYRNIFVNLKKHCIALLSYSDRLFIYTLNDLTKSLNVIKLSPHIDYGKYSYDGSVITVGDFQSISLVNPYASVCMSSDIHCEKNENFQAIAYPNNTILAVLATRFAGDNSFSVEIKYYDIITKQRIYQSGLFNWNGNAYDLSFSTDGTKGIIVLGDRSVVISVPFEVRYQSNIKQKVPYCLFLLNQLGQAKQLPFDVIQYFKIMLSETFKR